MLTKNRCEIEGHLTRKPELGYTPKGMAYCWCTLGMGKDDGFITIEVYGSKAQDYVRQLDVGDAVQIDGALTYRHWTDKQGQKHSKHTITANRILPVRPIKCEQPEEEPPKELPCY